jgi:hypothetical protein
MCRLKWFGAAFLIPGSRCSSEEGDALAYLDRDSRVLVPRGQEFFVVVNGQVRFPQLLLERPDVQVQKGHVGCKPKRCIKRLASPFQLPGGLIHDPKITINPRMFEVTRDRLTVRLRRLLN